MPQKRANPTELHPPSSSSEEENAESSSDEGKEQEPSLSKSSNESEPSLSKSSNESESDAESESEAEEEHSDAAPTPAKPSSKKRGRRLWSKDDEIAFLKGIIEYKAKTPIDPVADFYAFRDFIKGRLHFDFEFRQLKVKFRTLRSKVLQNHFRNEQGEARKDSHDQLVYDLSKRIWRLWLAKRIAELKMNGNIYKMREKAKKGMRKKNNVGDERQPGSKKRVNKKNNGGDERQPGSKKRASKKDNGGDERQPGSKKRVKFDRSFCGGSANMEEFVMKKGMEFMDDKKRIEMEEKWKKLQLEKLKLFAKKQELLQEGLEMVMPVLEA